jgi:hypothetical protein
MDALSAGKNQVRIGVFSLFSMFLVKQLFRHSQLADTDTGSRAGPSRHLDSSSGKPFRHIFRFRLAAGMALGRAIIAPHHEYSFPRFEVPDDFVHRFLDRRVHKRTSFLLL